MDETVSFCMGCGLGHSCSEAIGGGGVGRGVCRMMCRASLR
jgi:hypothetical protein